MDIFLIIGLVLGAICIMMALILKGASVAMLLNGEVAVIIFGGMIAAVLSSYTMADIKRLPKVMKVLMSNEEPDLNGTIEKMVELSNIARREGLLALEAPVNELDDPFMKQGLELVVDGAEAEQIRDLMESEVDAMETRHHRMSGLFKTAGATSPTLGVMGAAIGLIGALGNLSDINKLGPMIASAFVATIFGIFMGYLVMIPFATRLEAKNEEEVLLKTLIIEGVMDIQAGHSAKVIEQEKSNLNQANEDCQKLAKEKEEDLRKFAIKLSEILIKKQLDVDASTITNILAPVFMELEKPDEMIIVRANACYKQPLIDRLDKMHKEVPNLRYSVLEDEGLEPYTVKIESNESFITVDIKEDLEKFLKSLGEQNEHD